MDVSARIDEGRSWQLAAYIAHIAQQQETSEEVTVFATGEVDSELKVRPVERVSLKLEALARQLDALGFNTEKAIILVPENERDAPSQIGGVPVRRVSTASEALALAGLAAPTSMKVPSGNIPERESGRRVPSWAILAGVVLVAAAFFWIGGDFARWSSLAEQGRILDLEQDMAAVEDTFLGGWRAATYRKWRNVTKPRIGRLDIDGSTLLAEDAAACADKTALEKRRMTQVYTGTAVVCSVEIRAVSDVRGRVVIGRLAYWPNGLGNEDRATRVMRGSHENSGRTWTLEFAQLPEAGAALRLVIISGAVDINGSQPWYQDLLSAHINSAAFAAARDRLQRLGFDTHALDWRRK
ncbi:MAG: hypothetical protein JJ900_02835 [Rhodospirillales bacterium]|nr:hypothetical protein [Rhodospirillales bacterium]MBO6785759.1 hypothetical protein [Rhodospirillales bacterium]